MVPLISLSSKTVEVQVGQQPSLETATPGSTAYNLFGFGSTRIQATLHPGQHLGLPKKLYFPQLHTLNDQDDD